MRKKYSNQLFHLVKNLGIEPNNLEMEDITDGVFIVKVIKYIGTPLSFFIREETGSFDLFDYKYNQFKPGFPQTLYYPYDKYVSFNEVLDAFKFWINSHVMEYLFEENEPDLWNEFKLGNKSLNIEAIDFSNRDNFSADERKQIVMSINELRFLIHNEISPNEEEKLLIKERLEYLIESTNRLNKYDWKGLVITTLIGIATTLSLDTEKGILLFELFKRVFNN